jgi:hypothetical protein
LFDGLIIAVEKVPNHQQCRAPLMLKQQSETVVLIICKKVFEEACEKPEIRSEKHRQSVF